MRCLVGDHNRNWDLTLPTTQFAYTSFVNRSIGMGLVETVHYYKPRRPLDLPMPSHISVSESADALAQHFHDLHNEISKQIQATNAQYKIEADLCGHLIEFNIGDYVIVWIRSKRSPPGSVQKLQAHSAGLFKVLQWVESNVYVIDVPPGLGISSTFNVENLVAYTSHTVIPDDPFNELSLVPNTNPIPDPIQPSFSPAHKESIDTILV